MYQAVNILFTAVKLGILTCVCVCVGGGGVYGTESLLGPASSGQSMDYSFNHLRVFTRESGRLPLGHFLVNENKDIMEGLFEQASRSLSLGHTHVSVKVFPWISELWAPADVLWSVLCVVHTVFDHDLHESVQSVPGLAENILHLVSS